MSEQPRTDQEFVIDRLVALGWGRDAAALLVEYAGTVPAAQDIIHRAFTPDALRDGMGVAEPDNQREGNEQ